MKPYNSVRFCRAFKLFGYTVKWYSFLKMNSREEISVKKILEVINAEKYYGNKANVTAALCGLSFSVEEGEFVGIMGASGSGKTTLLNCISTIDKLSAGQVLIDEQDIKLFDRIRDKNAIILLNKSDLPVKTKTEEVRKYTDKYVMSVSAKDESGIDEFKEKIEEMFISGKIGYNDEVIITNERHLFLIDDAINSVKAVLDGISAGYAEDFLSIDLMNSYESLGKVIGEKVEDDIVDEIFSRFCMGK